MDLTGTSKLHYSIIGKLGEGGMGVVYKALDTKLKREVAIKFLTRKIATNSVMRLRFLVEAQAVATLNHPNIATIYAIEELEEKDGQEEIFFVMEYINGMELRHKIKYDRISIVEALDIALQIAEGLLAAHEKGITHRDIKPSNIMLTSKGRVKLMDFGLAKIGEGIQLTQTNATIGTVAYMSPEQARGEKVDHRSDIWSFGVVLYEMLAGSLPFYKDREHVLIYSIIHEMPIPLSREGEQISPSLVKIVDRALTKNPDERYQDMKSLIRDLLKSASELNREPLGNENEKEMLDQTVVLHSRILPDKTSIADNLETVAVNAHVSNARKNRSGYLLAGIFSVIAIGAFYWWNFYSGGTGLATQAEEVLITTSPGLPAQPEGQSETARLETPNSVIDAPSAQENPIQEDPIETTPLPERKAPDKTVAVPAQTNSSVPQEINTPTLPDEKSISDTIVNTQALALQATQARAKMIEAEESVPGSVPFKSTILPYASAREAQLVGQTQFDLSNYQEAVDHFEKARTAYIAAREAAIVKLKAQADEAKVSMEQAESRLSDQNPENEDYRRAMAKKEEGNRAYIENDFERAAGLYAEGQQLFIQTAELSARESDQTRKLETLTSETKLLLKSAFEDRDIARLESVVVLSDQDKATWQGAFSSFKDIRVSFVEENLTEINNNRFQLKLTSVLNYLNNKNEGISINFVLTGTMTNENDKWSSSKFDMRFDDR